MEFRAFDNIGTFHAVAAGVEVASHYELKENILRLIAGDSWSIDEDGVISYVLMDDIVFADNSSTYESIGTVGGAGGHLLESLTFKHREHEWIRFGSPNDCTYMMYIACIGDDFGAKLEDVEFTDEQLLTFLKVKNEFINQKRLPVGSNFSLRPNCCYSKTIII
jgi:hypothetical protein